MDEKDDGFPVKLFVPVIEEVIRRVPGFESRFSLSGGMAEFSLPKMEEALPDTWIMKHRLTKKIWDLCFGEEDAKNYRQYNAAAGVEKEAREEIDAVRAVMEERNIYPGSDGGSIEGKNVSCLAGRSEFEVAVEIWKHFAFRRGFPHVILSPEGRIPCGFCSPEWRAQ